MDGWRAQRLRAQHRAGYARKRLTQERALRGCQRDGTRAAGAIRFHRREPRHYAPAQLQRADWDKGLSASAGALLASHGKTYESSLWW